jgi:hypothetical protein
VETGAKDANSPIARQILGYFLRNPGAADSLLEIARWRLMQETVLESVEATHAALEVLMAEGFVTQEVRLGTERIFHLNAERKAEAEDFLRSAGKDVTSKEGTE